MTGRRIAGIVCCILAVGFFVSGLSNVISGPDVTDASGLGVSYAVGAFLPAILALIAGIWLLTNKKS
jgi:hypothetical protein